MGIKKYKRVWLMALISWLVFSAFIVPENTVKQDNQTLFTIARSKDANEIWYTLNVNNKGDLDEVNPVNIFWLKKTENNSTEPLTWIQSEYAYGIKFIENEQNLKDTWNFQFASYNKHTFELRKNSENQYKVFTKTEGKEIEINRIFIQIDGGSFWFPKISYVKIFGKDTQTNNNIVETITPDKLTEDGKNHISYLSQVELK